MSAAHIKEQAKDDAAEDLLRATADIHAFAEKLASIKTMDIGQLAALYDCCVHINDATLAHLNAPRFEGEHTYTLNAAGEFLDSFKDVTAWLTQAVVGQLRSRYVYKDDLNAYAETLLNWESRCGVNPNSLAMLLEELKQAFAMSRAQEIPK